MAREGGKAKALRIDSDYYRRWTWLEASRVAAIVVALLGATIYGGWVLALARRTAFSTDAARSIQLSTGPLALVHAHFENDCQKCHADQLGVALAHDAWQRDAEQRLRLQEEKCQKCHAVKGHARALLTNPKLDRDCGACHRDHRGRANRLAQISDKTCTACHADLDSACNATTNLKLCIEAFDVSSHGVAMPLPTPSRDQPSPPATTKLQFRSLLKDRGRVRFDHAQHLRPGQVDSGSKGGFQLGMLAPELRSLYGEPGQDDSGLVQLRCDSCHTRYAIAEPLRPNATDREQGRYYAPVKFDKHCAACHQMTFAGQGIEDLPLPHVAQREEFAKLLSAKQAGGSVGGKVTEPGDQALRPSQAETTARVAEPAGLKHEKIEATVTAVFARCLQCHFEEDTQPNVIASALAGTLDSLIPQRWLQRGYFDHASHTRITRCAYCHAMPTEVGAPRDHEKVLIGGPDRCVVCHRSVDEPMPAEVATEAMRRDVLGQADQPMWASAACIECHRYHWTRPAAAHAANHAVSP